MNTDKLFELAGQIGNRLSELSGAGWDILVQFHNVNAFVLTTTSAIVAIFAAILSFILYRKVNNSAYRGDPWDLWIPAFILGLASVVAIMIGVYNARGIFIPEAFALRELIRTIR